MNRSVDQNMHKVRDWLPAEVLAAVKAERSLIPVRADKRPAIEAWKPYQKRRPSGEEFMAWAAQKPAGWAQVCGEVSGVITADFDGDAGAETMRSLGLNPHRRTGSGGYHVDVAYPGFRVPTLNGKAKADLGSRWPGLDIRGDGGYAIIAGRNDAGAYEWLRPIDPDPPDILPTELWAFLRGEQEANVAPRPAPRPSGATDRDCLEDAILRRALADTPSMGRNNAGFGLACQARDNGLGEGEALDLLRTFAARAPAMNLKGQPEPYTEVEQRASVREAYSRSPREPWQSRVHSNGHRSGADDRVELEAAPPSFGRTDAGNGELMAYLYGDQLRFDHKRGHWLEWAGDWWQQDGVEAVVQKAKAAARWRNAQALNIENVDERKREQSWANGSESRRRIEAMLALARTEADIADSGEGWDTATHLHGVLNGVIDLRTGELRRGRPEDKITKHAPVVFDPTASCPTFDAFLARVQPDPGMRRYLQRRGGYALTADTSEQDLVFHHGAGLNGKTTFANALMDTMGSDYAKQAAPGLLLRSYRDRHPTELADLDGARLIVSTEVDDGRALAEELVKQLTGGDRLKARRMRQDFYQFEAGFKIMLLANHKPAVRGTDWAIWRRIKLVPWDVTILPEERDPHLRDKLKTEASGILNWMIAGCLDWQRNGMQEPAGVTAATEVYRADSDPLSAFLSDCCISGERYTVAAGALFKAYEAWAIDQGIGERDPARMNATAFGKLAGERFDRGRRGKARERCYRGIGLLSEDQEPLSADAFGPGRTRFESEASENPVSPKSGGLADVNLENASNASACVRPGHSCGKPTDADLCEACQVEATS